MKSIDIGPELRAAGRLNYGVQLRKPMPPDQPVTHPHAVQSVAILYHPHRPEALAEAEWIDSGLRERGLKISSGNGWDPTVVRKLCRDTQLVVALGGDGTILHVARLAAPYGVPVLGVNLGRVGFLAEITPQALRGSLHLLAEGRFWIERRAMLDVEWHTDEAVENFPCLNEAAVARGVSARAVHVDTLLDGQEFMTFTADAVLAATATGSTAYSLAAGGPILYPEATDYMITPVAPHLHIGRSVVVPGEMKLTLRLATDRPAILTVDGTDERTLGPDHSVQVRRSAMTAQFARLGEHSYFYSAIADRLK